jgi:hypothetical protein
MGGFQAYFYYGDSLTFDTPLGCTYEDGDHVAPDPLAVGTIAERHRSHVPVLRRSEVDRVLAAAAAVNLRLGHAGRLTLIFHPG